MNQSKWPLDFDQLTRGMTLSREQIEDALNIKATDQNYRLKALWLAEQIREHFLRKGDIVTVVSRSDALRILTHPEQAAHAPLREEQGIRKIMIAQMEGRAVDLAQLSDSERQQHEAWMRRSSWRAQQVLKPPPPELT